MNGYQVKLYHEPFYRFAFSEQRKIEKIHLPEAKPLCNIVICKKPILSELETDIIEQGKTDSEGWVKFSKPLIVMPGDVFYAFLKDPI